MINIHLQSHFIVFIEGFFFYCRYNINTSWLQLPFSYIFFERCVFRLSYDLLNFIDLFFYFIH